MANIILNDMEIEVEDGSEIKDACEALGVEFGCKNGFCRTCEVVILEGYENLSALSENEEFISLPANKRLCCQCKIKKGFVKIKIE